MAKFVYNNSWQVSIIICFEVLLDYHSQMFCKDNHDLQSKSRFAEKNTAILRDLMKELKVNLVE